MEPLLLVFGRVAPVVALHPVCGGRSIPRLAAAGMALALSVAIYPSVADELAGGDAAPLPLRLLREITVGSVMGVLGQLAFGAIEAAARLVDETRGANAGHTYAPQLESFPSTLAALDVHLATAVFWAAGMHATLIGAMLASYEIVPVGALASSRLSLGVMTDAAGSLARTAVGIAAPAMAACALADLLFGLVNRSSPNANVFFLSQPVKLVVAVALMAATLPGRLDGWVAIWTLERATLSDVFK